MATRTKPTNGITDEGSPDEEATESDIAEAEEDVVETRRCRTWGNETVTVPEGFTVRNVDGSFHVHADGTSRDQLDDFYLVVENPDDIETVLREAKRIK